MIRRKRTKRTRRRERKKIADNPLPSPSQTDRNSKRFSSRCWINPQGKTVHWNCRTNCYTRRPRRFDKSVTAEAKTITPESQKKLLSFLEAKREVYQAKLRLRHSLHRDEHDQNLVHAKSRLQRTFSRRRSWSLKSSQ